MKITFKFKKEKEKYVKVRLTNLRRNVKTSCVIGRKN